MKIKRGSSLLVSAIFLAMTASDKETIPLKRMQQTGTEQQKGVRKAPSGQKSVRWDSHDKNKSTRKGQSICILL